MSVFAIWLLHDDRPVAMATGVHVKGGGGSWLAWVKPEKHLEDVWGPVLHGEWGHKCLMLHGEWSMDSVYCMLIGAEALYFMLSECGGGDVSKCY